MRRLGDLDPDVREHIGGSLVGVEDERPPAVVRALRHLDVVVPGRHDRRPTAGSQLVNGHCGLDRVRQRADVAVQAVARTGFVIDRDLVADHVVDAGGHEQRRVGRPSARR